MFDADHILVMNLKGDKKNSVTFMSFMCMISFPSKGHLPRLLIFVVFVGALFEAGFHDMTLRNAKHL